MDIRYFPSHVQLPEEWGDGRPGGGGWGLGSLPAADGGHHEVRRHAHRMEHDADGLRRPRARLVVPPAEELP